MAQFDENILNNLQMLSRIKLTDEEIQEFKDNLENILDSFELLQQVNTEQVENRLHLLQGKHDQLLRDDEIGDILPRDDFLENAPQKVAGMVQVPLIIKS